MNNTSKNLDNGLSSALHKVLLCIKKNAPIGTTSIAEHLSMSGEAARQHVQKLRQMSLIDGETNDEIQVGRPKQQWIITQKGNRYFPDSHAQLTIQLIDSVKEVFGEEGLNKLINEREYKVLKQYENYCQADTVLGRLEKLTEMRFNEGYMAHLEKDGDDYLLIEEHCPICSAAKVCQKFCRSELQLFQSILGKNISIQREQYLLEAGQRCVYRIKLSKSSLSASF